MWVHLNQVDSVVIRENSVHAIGQFFPRPGYWKGVQSITVGVQTHVVGTFQN